MTIERVQYFFEPLYIPSGSIGGVTTMEISWRWGEMGGRVANARPFDFNGQGEASTEGYSKLI